VRKFLVQRNAKELRHSAP